MSDAYVGEIRLFPFNFAPKSWATCSGQLLAISQNTALFSILGTQYGGDGRSTFALPNLQGQIVVGQGQGAGLSQYFIGEEGGAASVTLLTSEMPQHNHSLNAASVNGTVPTSTGNQPAVTQKVQHTSSVIANSYATSAPNATMSPTVLSLMGGNLPHNNLQPYLAMTYCIALQGYFPPRS